MTIRLSPVLRSNLRVALMPLGVALVTRGLAELEALIEGRMSRLADVEHRLAARELVLGRLDERPDPDPAPWTGCEHVGCEHRGPHDHESHAAAATVP